MSSSQIVRGGGGGSVPGSAIPAYMFDYVVVIRGQYKSLTLTYFYSSYFNITQVGGELE